MKKTVTDSIREALGGMTEDGHKELQDSGWTPKDESRKDYTKDDLELPASRALKMERNDKKKPVMATPN